MAGHFANAIKETNNAKLIAISSTRNRNLHSFGDKFEIDSKFRFEEWKNFWRKYDEVFWTHNHS